MDRKDFQFFVTAHKTKEDEHGLHHTLELKTGSKHKLTFKSDSSDLFEGYPIGTAVGVKLYNPQKTLSELKEEGKE